MRHARAVPSAVMLGLRAAVETNGIQLRRGFENNHGDVSALIPYDRQSALMTRHFSTIWNFISELSNERLTTQQGGQP